MQYSTDAVHSRDITFRSKQTTNKVPPQILTGFEVKVPEMFSRPKDSPNGKSYVFSNNKQIN